MEESFDPPLDEPSAITNMLSHIRDCFTTSVEFLERMGFDMPEPTANDKKEAMQIYHATPDAPPKPTTLGAAIILNKMLSKHDYVLTDPSNKMRNYVVYKLFEHAESEDPKVSLKALEFLAKSSDVGLFTERVEININQKSTVELESDLSTLIKSIARRSLATPNVIDASDAEFTDA